MKYTYRVSIQGFGITHYLEMTFDRTLNDKYSSYGRDTLKPTSQKTRLLMERINNTKGIVKIGESFRSMTSSGGGLITIDGNKICAKLETPTENIPAIANNIVKKVQRLYAPNEPRQRIQIQVLNDYIDNLNKRVYGK